jgi:uroporphyrinogen-III decarboxylase
VAFTTGTDFGTQHGLFISREAYRDLFNRDGGFVFNSTHNIQAKTPVKNIVALFKAIKDSAGG